MDPVTALGKLRQLEEEEPQLHVLWQEEKREIHMQVMGQVQMEILKNILWERFGLEAEFDAGSIVYKETLAEPVEGTDILNPCDIMQKYTCCWNRVNGAAACNLPLCAVRICWIGTGRD